MLVQMRIITDHLQHQVGKDSTRRIWIWPIDIIYLVYKNLHMHAGMFYKYLNILVS